MFKRIIGSVVLGSAIGLMGIGPAAAEDSDAPTAAMRTAALTPQNATPDRPGLASINQRLVAMQQQIDKLKEDLHSLRQAGSGSQSTHSADEAYTIAQEARSIALRAEQKADQALAAANSN